MCTLRCVVVNGCYSNEYRVLFAPINVSGWQLNWNLWLMRSCRVSKSRMAEKILIKLFIKHYLHLEMDWKALGTLERMSHKFLLSLQRQTPITCRSHKLNNTLCGCEENDITGLSVWNVRMDPRSEKLEAIQEIRDWISVSKCDYASAYKYWRRLCFLLGWMRCFPLWIIWAVANARIIFQELFFFLFVFMVFEFLFSY